MQPILPDEGASVSRPHSSFPDGLTRGKGRPRLRKAIADAYSPLFGRTLDPETEVTITTGANEGMLCAFMAFIEPGDEVVVFEPFFDQYVSNIEMPGGTVRYVPLHPPEDGAERTSSAANWTVDFGELERAINENTKMIVGCPQALHVSVHV
jgi:kynurenine aminotransferase